MPTTGAESTSGPSGPRAGAAPNVETPFMNAAGASSVRDPEVTGSDSDARALVDDDMDPSPIRSTANNAIQP
jgi:hypothetical protein